MRHLLIVVLRPLLRPFGYRVGTLGGRFRIMRWNEKKLKELRVSTFQENCPNCHRRFIEDVDVPWWMWPAHECSHSSEDLGPPADQPEGARSNPQNDTVGGV